MQTRTKALATEEKKKVKSSGSESQMKTR